MVYITEDEVRMTNEMLGLMADRRHAMEGGLASLVEVLTYRIALISIVLETGHLD